jgi:nucleoside-diphosphate-sugar epimerase
MKHWTVTLTGATGFIGSAVLRRLRECSGQEHSAIHIRAAGRAPLAGLQGMSNVEWVQADLTDPASLRGVCDGADVLVHAASYIGKDEALCEAVNRHGSAALVEEAAAAGVGRIIQLSTSAVYGAGPHRGISVDEVIPAPVSAASRSRLAAERSALAAGGLVLRPGLVLGPGDRWVVPALAELIRRVPTHWDGGRGLLSLVAVEDLARLIAAAVTAADAVVGIHHASHPEPVSSRELMAGLAAAGVLARPADDLPWEACLRRLRATQGWVNERQFALLATDHYYRSDQIWRALDCSPGPGPLARLGAAAAWYREQLTPERAE